MKAENIKSFVTEAAEFFPAALSAQEGNITFLRLPNVRFPLGCAPPETSALIVLDPGQPAPQLLLEELPRLPNGKIPRSTSAISAAGKSWFTYSFNQQWTEEVNTALQFIEGRLRRFALNE